MCIAITVIHLLVIRCKIGNWLNWWMQINRVPPLVIKRPIIPKEKAILKLIEKNPIRQHLSNQQMIKMAQILKQKRFPRIGSTDWGRKGKIFLFDYHNRKRIICVDCDIDEDGERSKSLAADMGESHETVVKWLAKCVSRKAVELGCVICELFSITPLITIIV